MTMDKVQAIRELMTQARSTRRHSTASAKRAVAACNALGLDPTQRQAVLWELEYCDHDGNPFGAVKKVW